MRILGTNHCGELRRTAFKRRELFQDVLCRRDYADRVVSSITISFLVYIFVDLSGEDSCLHTEQILLSFNESLP